MFTYLHTMPDKRYVKGCGKGCVRCWVNRQNHGNKLKKKFFPKKFEMNKSWMSEEKEYFSFFEEFIDEVLKSANNTPFGLSAVLWTQNLSRALQFVEEIEAGFVQVNQCVAPRANVSYGGLKMSGLGKEYAFDSMINHFTQSKTVLINRGKSIIDK